MRYRLKWATAVDRFEPSRCLDCSRWEFGVHFDLPNFVLAGWIKVSRYKLDDDGISVAFSNTVPSVIEGNELGNNIYLAKPTCGFGCVHLEDDTPVLESTRTAEVDTTHRRIRSIIAHVLKGDGCLHGELAFA